MQSERRSNDGSLRALWTGAFVLALSSLAGPVHAVDLKLLVMPGPLVAGHADLEKDCGQCHRSFDSGAQSDLCLACHEEIASDLMQHSGLHGRRESGPVQECRSCHPDHRGRDADVLGLSPDTFDHADTDFALEGGHRTPPCSACHQPGKAYREAPSDCGTCHADDDRHEGRLGSACGDCHRPASWREAVFDHASTDFPLTGAHVKADCGLCHPGDRYEHVAKECSACHSSQDVHRGRLGTACADCHNTARWREGSFDHDRSTRFPLVGEHRTATCNACHLQGTTVKLDMACRSCHAAEDDHDGSFGTRCDSCHTPKGWKRSVFDHARDAHFGLSGAHASTPCTSCHRGVLEKESLSRLCVDCHSERDVHAGQLGRRCDSCHGSRSWSADLKFDHDLTPYPLLGMHAVAACERCHESTRFHDVASDCRDCHEADDVHRRRLGSDCSTCHNPNGWSLWQFDHDRETRFELRGRHEDLDCLACHTAPSGDKIRLSSRCESCHSLDDPHRGGFGSRCQTCHDESAWTHVRVPR